MTLDLAEAVGPQAGVEVVHEPALLPLVTVTRSSSASDWTIRGISNDPGVETRFTIAPGSSTLISA